MTTSARRAPEREGEPMLSPQSSVQRRSGEHDLKTVQIGTTSVVTSLSKECRDSIAQRPGWTSDYLKNTTLLGFIVLFLCLLLAVVALAVVDAKEAGIATAKSNEHYLWTYGPTAVLVVVAAMWNQVEFRTKQAMPWMLLQKGPTPASTTLSMDYITPSKPEAFMSALRSAHWPVVIAIMNSTLITMLTVASTGLLDLQKTSFTRQHCQLNVTNAFATNFEPSTIGSSSVLATLAILNGTIPFPPGTTYDAAFQTLLPPESLSGSNDIEVEGLAASFQAGLDCEVATVRSGASDCSDWQCHGLNVTLNVISPTCEIKAYNFTTGCSRGLDAIDCDIETIWGADCDTYANGHDKKRLVFMIGQVHQDLGKATRNGTQPVQVIAGNTTTMVCEPKYSITDTNVRLDHNGNVESALPKLTATNLTQPFPAWDLVDAVRIAADASGAAFGRGYAYRKTDYFPWLTFQALLDSWLDIKYPSSDLKNSDVLQSRVNEMFSMVTAQMAKQNLMRASTGTTIGTCYGTEDRLRVRDLSLYLMGTALCILILSTACLLYIAPRNYTSRDPSSIGGLALVLSQSPRLLSRLSAYGSADIKTTRDRLQDLDCQTLLSPDQQEWQFSVDLIPNESTQDILTQQTLKPSADVSWTPMSLRPIFKIMVIAFLLILVIVLEVLYSVSQKQDGLAEVDPKRYMRFAWVYIPAIVMLTAQTMVGAIAFSSFMIFPYFRLRKQSSNSCNDILRDYVSHTAVECLWKALSTKHVAILCMALATLLTPLLTIAVSGLYIALPVSVEMAVTLSIRNQLNSSFLPSDLSLGSNFLPAANNIGLLLTQNFTYPPWTYDELGFLEATLELPDTAPSDFALPGSNLTATISAIRSDLNCTMAPSWPRNFTNLLKYKTNVTVSAFQEAGVDQDILWPSPGLDPFGFFSSCEHDGYHTIGNKLCGAFGLSEVDWKAFTCSSVINELEVRTTMDASTLAIIDATPDESTARLFSNETLYPPSAGSFPSGMIPTLFGSANFAGSTAGFYDPIFQAVIYELGTRDNLTSFPMAEYMNDSGFEKIAARLEHIHRTITAQSALTIRIPVNSSSPLAPPPTVNATLRNPNFHRLQQSAVSTRILDGLLLAIALCIALSFGLMDTRNILPKNPASIAAGASLIAGESEMLREDVLPKEAQWYSDADLALHKIWDGVFFRLGWWDGNGSTEQGRRFKLDSM